MKTIKTKYFPNTKIKRGRYLEVRYTLEDRIEDWIKREFMIDD